MSGSFDLQRERAAEAKAAELLRSVVGEENWAMYRELGFLRVRGGDARSTDPRIRARYAYLVYPHRPLVAFDEGSGQVLGEYCVGFPDRTENGENERLPDSDDVLAKWMALTGDERGLLADANVLEPGRQIDPGQVERDLGRLRGWDSERSLALAPNNLPL